MVAEEPEHEQGVVADVAPQRPLVLGGEARIGPVPHALDLEQGIGHRVEAPARQGVDGAEGLGAREAGQEVGEVAGGARVVEREVTEGLRVTRSKKRGSNPGATELSLAFPGPRSGRLLDCRAWRSAAATASMT